MTSMFQFPIGYPECGWEGQFCQSDVGLGVSATAGIASAVTVVFIMALGVVLGLQRYRYIVCLPHRGLLLREFELIDGKETNVLLISRHLLNIVCHGPLTRYVKLWVAHTPGTFSQHHGLAIPTCITARASHTCHDAYWGRLLTVSFEVGDGDSVPRIPGACATRNFTYLLRGL